MKRVFTSLINIQIIQSHFWQPSLLGSVRTGRWLEIYVKGGFTG